ncbi:tryptophan synthase subunit alpha [Helicobacter cynogastricus]|uniref:tryptophan synthase subunit alpha n=1 Tax=Helicobacter cynogastricus TaxID=329937 RepID=UPI000CF17FB3|nr:tryptophan synthase subunit alpha [Helicobacter cynogastricus]
MRYAKIFEKRGVFVPFVMLGDPSYEMSFEIIKTLVDAGVDALELGFAFSDPMADGPIIQASHLRALQHSTSMRANFVLLERVRAYAPHIPIGLLLYANLVHRFGLDDFYHACAQSGVDSVLIADVPLCESAPFVHSAQKHQIAPIFIVAPHTNQAYLEQVAKQSLAYIYVLARRGVTGASQTLGQEAKEVIAHLKELTPLPCLLGFGISKPIHVQEALDLGADGVICGSAIVKIIEEELEDSSLVLENLRIFAEKMRMGLCYN